MKKITLGEDDRNPNTQRANGASIAAMRVGDILQVREIQMHIRTCEIKQPHRRTRLEFSSMPMAQRFSPNLLMQVFKRS